MGSIARRPLGQSAWLLLAYCAIAQADGKAVDSDPRLGGRLHVDFAIFGNDDRGPPSRNDIRVRRAWLELSGQSLGLGYKLQLDFSEPREVRAREIYLSRGFASGRLLVGQFKQHFMLDDCCGGAATTLAPRYRLGVAWQDASPQANWAASAYSLESLDVWQVRGQGVSGRVAWVPPSPPDRLLHLGVSMAGEHYLHPGAPGTPPLRIRPRPAGPLSGASRVTLVDFSAGRDTDALKWSLEYAQVRGPWSWQSELSGAQFDDGGQRGEVRAWYGWLSCFVTGETRNYDRRIGRFNSPGAVRHAGGALELVLRYDTLWGHQHPFGEPDLRSARTEIHSLGVNWYLRPNLRLMLDLIDSRSRDRLAGLAVDRTRAVAGSLQYQF